MHYTKILCLLACCGVGLAQQQQMPPLHVRGNLTVDGNAVIGPKVPNLTAPIVTVHGTAGSAAYSYAVVAAGSSQTYTSPATVILTGNASLSASNYNIVTTVAIGGTTSCTVYRTAGGSTQGIIGTTTCGSALNDTGLAGDGSTAPVATVPPNNNAGSLRLTTSATRPSLDLTGDGTQKILRIASDQPSLLFQLIPQMGTYRTYFDQYGAFWTQGPGMVLSGQYTDNSASGGPGDITILSPSSESCFLCIWQDTLAPAVILRAGGDPASANPLFQTMTNNSALITYVITADGVLHWGAGSSRSNLDTDLYRYQANGLKTDGTIYPALGVQLGTDAFARTTAGGGIVNGSNTNAADTGASTYGTVAGGVNNSEAGYFSTVAGGNGNTAGSAGHPGAGVTNGVNNSATLDYSRAGGYQASTAFWGEDCYSSGNFATPGDAQGCTYIARQTTTSASVGYLALNGAYVYGAMPAGGVWAFSALVSANRTDASDYGAWRIDGAVKTDAGGASTIAFVGSPSVTVLGRSDTNWTVTPLADTGSGMLLFSVTGAAGKTIHWVGRVQLAQAQ